MVRSLKDICPMNEKMFCEKCGAEMIDRSEGDSIFVECPNCGWGWATTTYDPSMDDETEYEIWLRPGNAQSPEMLRLIADIANVNLLQAKKMLNNEEPVLLYKAYREAAAARNRVQKTQDVATRLAEANVLFYIVPDFK